MDVDLQTIAFIMMILFLACALFVIAKFASVESSETIIEQDSK